MATTIVASGTTASDLVITSGNSLTVQATGTVISADILSGASATISGVDSGSVIALGGVETVTGSATLDTIGGTQLLAGGNISNELISGGTLLISGGDSVASGITISDGGSVVLESKGAKVTGSLTFTGAGSLQETSVVSGTAGDQAVISGFGLGDFIDLTAIGNGGSLTSVSASGNTVLTVAGGSTEFVTSGTFVTQAFTLAGTGTAFTLIEDADGAGSDIALAAAVTTIASGQTAAADYNVGSGLVLDVLAGGSATNLQVLSGGLADLAGNDTGTTIALGGVAEIQPTGVSTDAVVFGTLDLFATGGIANNVTVQNGGTLALSANAPVTGLVLSGGTVLLESKKSNISGAISFAGAGTFIESAIISAGFGAIGTITGFNANDVIELTAIGTGATLTTNTIGGSTTVLSVSGGSAEGALTESFTFAGTNLNLQMSAIAGGGDAITLNPVITVASGTTSTGAIINAGYTLDVLAGGSVTGAQILSGGSAIVAGSDSGSTVFLGGSATITGTASGDIISGTETVSGSDTGNRIALGGTEIVTGSASADVILGTEIISGSASNLTLNGGTLNLASSTASLTGGLSFTGQSTLEETVLIATGSGVGALITGFGTGDVIDLSAIGTGATLTSATSGANAVVSITGGSTEGSATESFTFANAAGSIFSLLSISGGSISGGDSFSIVSPVITVGAGTVSTGDTVSAGYELKVLATGTEVSGQILAGGTALISGTDQGSSIALGGAETVATGGSATGDTVFGTQTVSGTASGETIGSTGAVTIAANGGFSNILLNGGVLELSGTTSSLSGGITFAGAATLREDGLTSPAGLITGFGTNDTIDLAAIGTGAIITSTTAAGNTILTISGGTGEGAADLTVTMAGTGNIYALGKDAAGTGETLTEIPILTSFTAGDIVVGVIGDDNDSGDYGDNQAAPIALEEFTTSGQLVGEMVLSDSNSTLNGILEYGISGEYGSSSEGILQLSGDGQSLVIAGYNVNAATYNAAEVSGGINTYGTAALAQTTSLESSTTATPVARVIADISSTGTVDTSTALYNIFNTNNPRSVATVDGQVFYISGQGAKDGTQGVFVANDGASAATAIDSSTDTRDIEIYNGQLYVSQNSSEGTSNIETFGALPVNGATTPSILSGIDISVSLTAAQANSVNAGAVGTAVALSPEQFFFANATTLYVADGGQPKAGTIGDGGLQKWTLDTTTGQWQLAYTLSAGLNLVENGSVSGDTAGTTGLIGLTGVLNANGTVTFYATNSTIGDLDQTYVYTITDTVDATSNTGAAFTIVTTASPDTNVRGIAQAPSAPTHVTVTSGVTSAGLTISTGSTLNVLAGGSITGAVILSGGTATISGADTGSLIVADGGETVYGTATGDNVYGTQIVSGSVSNEIVYYGATLEVAAGGTAIAITAEVNGVVEISGAVTGLTLSGGVATLDEGGASIAGANFAGSGEIAELVAGTSITGIITGFGLSDVIDLEQLGTASVLTSAVIGGNTVETVTSGGVSQSFTLAGQYVPGVVTLADDGNGGVEITIGASTVATGTEEVTAGQFGADITIASGATLLVDAGGTVTADTILAGGTADISGIASNDVIAGSETIASGATVSGETITTGTLEVNAGANVSNIIVETGALLLDSSATLGGTLALGDAATLTVESGASLSAVISGFVSGDVIDITAITTGATLTSSTAGGNTIETVTSGGVSESFTFAGTSYTAGYFTLASGAGGETLATMLPTSAVVSNGQTSTGFTVTSGFTLDVLSGGTAASATVLKGGTANITGTDTGAIISSGGSINIASGGIETGATILLGGTETLIGPNSATGDKVYGLQQILNANGATGTILDFETIFNGGEVDLFFKTNTLENSTILSGGLFAINGNATGLDLTLAGGTIAFESPKANLTGTLDFASGTLLVSGAVISAGAGDLATIENFGAGDVIELVGFATGVLTGSTAANGNFIETITSGSVSESFTFAGTSEFALQTISGGGVALVSDASVVTSGTVTGSTLGNGTEIVVGSGGTVTDTTVQSGGTLVVNGGTETGGVVSTGGKEIISSGGAASGTTIINGGTQIVANGGTVTGAFIEQDSTQIISSGGAAIDTNVGDPSVQIVSAGATATGTTLTAGGELDVYGGVTSTTVDNGGTEILFTGGTAAFNLINSGGTLLLSGGTATDTTIVGGGTIIAETLAFEAGLTGTITGGELVVNDAGGTTLFSLQVDGDYSTDIVQVTEATDGKTELTLCFYPGTGIATPDGTTAVEALRPGDLVLTANGPLPVRWIGQSHIATRFADKQRSLPVRITAGALGNSLPVRDLLLSPDHAVFIGGILAQASALVNDVTILREYDVPAQFTYYHVELATHELLLAEGVQAESFVDNIDRMHFHNWDERTAPATPIAEMPYPRAKSQRQLPRAVRQMLAVAKQA